MECKILAHLDLSIFEENNYLTTDERVLRNVPEMHPVASACLEEKTMPRLLNDNTIVRFLANPDTVYAVN